MSYDEKIKTKADGTGFISNKSPKGTALHITWGWPEEKRMRGILIIFNGYA
jgi:hypothetical protein